MFDQTDQELETWVRRVAPGAAVTLAPPANDSERATVGLYLIEVAPEAGTSQAPRPLLVFLRYLVTVTGPDPAEAHHRLGELMFAALEHADWEVERAGIDPRLWAALGVLPRPAFALRVPVRRPRPQRTAPLVRHPLSVQQERMHPVEGVLLGPGEVGIADARIEWLDLNLWTRTDPRGRFRFPAAPPLASSRLAIQVKDRKTVIAGSELKQSSHGVEIRITTLEA